MPSHVRKFRHMAIALVVAFPISLTTIGCGDDNPPTNSIAIPKEVRGSMPGDTDPSKKQKGGSITDIRKQAREKFEREQGQAKP